MWFALRQAIAAGDDEQIIDAWWQLVEAGTAVSADLRQHVLAARIRRATLLESGSVPSVNTPRLPATSQASRYRPPVSKVIGQRRDAQQAVVASLRASLAHGHHDDISSAALRVRQLGAPADDIDWPTVYDEEDRVAAISQLTHALASDNFGEAGRAWAYITGRWPGALPDDLETHGRAAFHEWGMGLLREDRARMGNGHGH